MKKILSLALAAAMVAGMATTVFADPALIDYDKAMMSSWDEDLADYAVMMDTDSLFVYDDDEGFLATDPAEITTYGDKYGIAIEFHDLLEDRDQDRYDAYAEWELGESLVSDLQIEYAKGPNGYQYFVTFEVESSTTTARTDIAGFITVADTRSDADDNMDVDSYFEIGGMAENSKIYYPYDEDGMPAGASYMFEGDLEDIEFFDGDVIYTVDTANQNTKLNLATSSSFQSDFAAMYPEANLDFFKWSATPSFNRTGELVFYVDAEQDLYFYEVTEDGAKETAAEYDEEYEAFVLRTRTLGNYVISDMELDTEMADEPVEEEAPTEEAPEDVKPNPGTGR